MLKTTVRKKPTSTKSVDEFIDNAGSDLTEGEVSKKKPKTRKTNKVKKSQVPLVIPGPLLEELDAYIESSGTYLSRSMWICYVIKEKLNQEKNS